MRKIKKCDCGENILWEWIDENTIKILGVNGQDYEIGFNYIRLKCKKCGRMITESSNVAETISELFEITNKTLKGMSSRVLKERPFTSISAFDRKKILQNLSERQKEIFRVLTKGDFRTTEEEIAKKVALPKKIIHSHVNNIIKEIKKVKPDFSKQERIDITFR